MLAVGGLEEALIFSSAGCIWAGTTTTTDLLDVCHGLLVNGCAPLKVALITRRNARAADVWAIVAAAARRFSLLSSPLDKIRVLQGKLQWHSSSR